MRTYEHGAFTWGPLASHATLPVVVVDADTKVREHLASIIRSAGWQPRTFGSAEEVLMDPHAMVPGCFLMDIDLPGLSGLELQQLLAERVGISVIFASSRQDIRLTVQAMRAGAVNFLAKPVDRESVISSIREALDRSRWRLSREAEQSALRARLLTLSRRERQVMELIICGLMNKQVANELGIAEVTVKAHRRQVMSKMKVASLAELVRVGSKLHVASADDERNVRSAVGEGHGVMGPFCASTTAASSF